MANKLISVMENDLQFSSTTSGQLIKTTVDKKCHYFTRVSYLPANIYGPEFTAVFLFRREFPKWGGNGLMEGGCAGRNESSNPQVWTSAAGGKWELFCIHVRNGVIICRAHESKVEWGKCGYQFMGPIETIWGKCGWQFMGTIETI